MSHSQEDEPRLKYQRLGGSVPILLGDSSGDSGELHGLSASALAVGDKMLALGTFEGSVHLLDFSGHEVRRYDALHAACVTDLCFDADGEVLASASDDGSVALISLYAGDDTGEIDGKGGGKPPIARVEYHRPVKCVAIDPLHSRRSSRQFVAGGLAGQLILHARGWLGARDHVLHAGEGAVRACAWAPPDARGAPADLVAWANDRGVKVYDVGSQQRVAFIERPCADVAVAAATAAGGRTCASARPGLQWTPGGTELVIGWSSCVKVCKVRPGGPAPAMVGGGGGAGGGGPSGKAFTRASVEVVATLGCDGILCGAARMLLPAPAPQAHAGTRQLVTLVYPGSEPVDDGAQGLARTQLRPELRLVDMSNEELASDALSVRGFEAYRPPDYRLVCAPACEDARSVISSGEALYYVLSPKDVVLACARDADDHVLWLLGKGRFEDALAECGIAGWATSDDSHTRRLRASTLDEVGAAYLGHLLAQCEYERAAAMCPALLRGSAEAWERWVFHFAHLRQLPALAPYIPTVAPELRPTCYDVVLNGLLAVDAGEGAHETLLECVRAWPASLYAATDVTAVAEVRLSTLEAEARTAGGSADGAGEATVTGAALRPLREALAELYVIAGAHERALGAFLDAGDGARALGFVRRRRLWGAARVRCAALLACGGAAAAATLADHTSEVSTSTVVSAIDAAIARARTENSTSSDADIRGLREALHSYLDALFERDPMAGAEVHGRQVELYAEFAPERLMRFLRASPYYPLDDALSVCQRRNLHAEAVYVLGRMGSAKQALQLVLDELRDVPRAVEFCADQADDDLWDELIARALEDPQLAGELLEHAGAHLNPLRVLRRLPEGVPIPRLRDRLARIVSDFRTQSSLREGCNAILKADCAQAADMRLACGQRALRVPAVPDANVLGSNDPMAMPVPRRGKRGIQGSGRCCLCLEPILGVHGDAARKGFVAFYCDHTYHTSCIGLAERGETGSADVSAGRGSSGGGASAGKVRAMWTRAGMFAHMCVCLSAHSFVEVGVTDTSHSTQVAWRCLLCTTARSARAALASGIGGGVAALATPVQGAGSSKPLARGMSPFRGERRNSRAESWAGRRGA